MRKFVVAVLVAAVAISGAAAHFVYVVPAKEAGKVTVVFSDSLEPDENVPVAKIAGLKLTAVGKTEAAVELKADKHSLTADVPAEARVVYGSVTYGLFTKGERPALLVYHPKAVLGGATGKEATAGGKAVAEVVPLTDGGKVKFQFVVAGKPATDAEGSVMLPDGTKEKVTTDKEGKTPAFGAEGRYAVYLKYTEKKAGEVEGKKFEEVQHYATLVADVKK